MTIEAIYRFSIQVGLIPLISWLTNCTICNDVRICPSTVGLSVELVSEAGSAITLEDFSITAESDGNVMKGKCSFTAAGQSCFLKPAPNSTSSMKGEAVNSDTGVVLNFFSVSRENIEGPSRIKITIANGTTIIGSETFMPDYEIERPGGESCPYCQHANEQMMISLQK